MVARDPVGTDHGSQGKGTLRLKDPVCGMDVTQSKSYSASHGGAEYRFCSLACLEKFKAEPERFVLTR